MRRRLARENSVVRAWPRDTNMGTVVGELEAQARELDGNSAVTAKKFTLAISACVGVWSLHTPAKCIFGGAVCGMCIPTLLGCGASRNWHRPTIT